jgi:hypothetical protein
MAKRALFGGSIIASLDVAALRHADKIFRRIFGERPQGLADDYIEETYAIVAEFGVQSHARCRISVESELRGLKDVLAWLWLLVWMVSMLVGLAAFAITPGAVDLYLAAVLMAAASVPLTMGVIHGPIDGTSRKRIIHGEVFTAHTMSNRIFTAIWLINWL